MKILYIGSNVRKIASGADAVNKRNELILSQCQGIELYHFFLERKVNAIQKVQGYLGGLTHGDIEPIIKMIIQEKIDVIFISHSLLGKLSYIIKKHFPTMKIITFFHNVELHYAKEYLRVSGYSRLPFYLLAKYNELYSIKYSDYYLVLNSRDDKLLQETYCVKSHLILPVSYEDKFEESRVVANGRDIVTLLFVGVDFFPNIEAMRFFIKYVLPFVDAKLIIVGKGMDKYEDEFLSLVEDVSKIEVNGFVDDLAEYYYNASAVIAPIFSGGGMKTKIAEALMYGKTIIGTSEAFEGYKKDDRSMKVCNTKEEFINILNEKNVFSLSNFNKFSREIFLNNYDFMTVTIKFNNFLKSDLGLLIT